MYSPPDPASSPLARLTSKKNYPQQLFPPGHSSPLSMSSSPTYQAQARRQRQYKSQSSSRSFTSPPITFGVLKDTPQKQFLREKFKARCLEHAKEGRARAVRNRRESSSVNESSSDGFDMDGDSVMDDDAEGLDDELYRRVMINEERKVRHAQRVSFERDFGSSIDPNMYDDINALEWELTGQEPERRSPSPPSDDLDDQLIQEYLTELKEIECQEAREEAARMESGTINIASEDPGELEREFTAENTAAHPSPSRSMYSDFQMTPPPSSPSRSEPGSAYPGIPTWSCPFCSALTSRSHISCTACAAQYPLDHAESVWFHVETHPGVQHSDHVPLATTTPSESGVGVVMLCGARECDWCFAL